MKKVLLACALLTSCGLVATSCSQTTEDTFDTSASINLYSREAGSGTRECFFDGIGYGDVSKENLWEEGVTVSDVTSNGDMMTRIASDINGIGYCSLDGIQENSGITALSYNGVAPSEDTVIDGSYSLTRNFNYVIRDYEATTVDNAENKEAVIDAFVAFFSTVEGQAQIKSAGGIVTTSATSTLDDVISQYPVLSGTETVQLYTCGSTSVEKVVQSCIDYFVGAIPNKNITISMNQTGSGDAVEGISTGLNGTMCDIGFLSREINDEELASLTDNNDHDKICIDAVVAIVNSENTSVSNINGDVLTRMYKGELSTWAEVVSATENL